MKLHVVHHRDGRILAAAVEPAEGAENLFARPFPVTPDHYAAEVEVPEEHARMPLEEICVRFDIDADGPRLIARGEPGAVKQ